MSGCLPYACYSLVSLARGIGIHPALPGTAFSRKAKSSDSLKLTRISSHNWMFSCAVFITSCGTRCFAGFFFEA